jgi:hypothetical protein
MFDRDSDSGSDGDLGDNGSHRDEDSEDDKEEGNSSTSSSEDEDVVDRNIENYIEPYRPVTLHNEAQLDEHNNQDQGHDSMLVGTNTVYNASRQLYQPPTVQQFPGMAGKVYCTETTNNKVYEGIIGTLKSKNIYAPFSSKLEWEIAKWAKIQGPSSTAFSDLIKIDDVSQY